MFFYIFCLLIVSQAFTAAICYFSFSRVSRSVSIILISILSMSFLHKILSKGISILKVSHRLLQLPHGLLLNLQCDLFRLVQGLCHIYLPCQPEACFMYPFMNSKSNLFIQSPLSTLTISVSRSLQIPGSSYCPLVHPERFPHQIFSCRSTPSYIHLFLQPESGCRQANTAILPSVHEFPFIFWRHNRLS